MVEAAQIAEFDTEELESQLGESRRELFNLRFQLATGQLDNFTRINQVRKDVARMLTELRMREIAEAEGLAMEDLPGHRAAVRRREEDEALGRSRTTASERRAAARAAEEETEEETEADQADVEAEIAEDELAEDRLAEDEFADDELVEDELAEEIADDDGMARPEDYIEDAEADLDDTDDDTDGEEES